MSRSVQLGRVSELVVLLLLWGCGESIVPGSALDEPAFSFGGTIEPGTDETPLALGILWVDIAQQGDGNHVSGPPLIRSQIAANGTYNVDLFGEPPQGAVRWYRSTEDDGEDVAFAWGEIILYDDWDRDGTFKVHPLAERSAMFPPDQYRGMPVSQVLIYVAKQASVNAQIIGLTDSLRRKGYAIGVAHCDSFAWMGLDEPSNVVVQRVNASDTYPDLRPCLKSQPNP